LITGVGSRGLLEH